MDIDYTKQFVKQYKKQPENIKVAFNKRLKLLLESPDSKILNIHALKGQYSGLQSINVTGDVRALYYQSGDRLIIFAFIGTHSQLY